MSEENKEAKTNPEPVKQPEAPGITADTIEGVIQSSDELKKWDQARLDRHFSKSLETWKENNLEGIREEIRNELNPAETEEQKQIRELREKLAGIEAKEKRGAVYQKLAKQADEKGIPLGLVDLVVSDDEEQATANFEALTQALETYREGLVKDVLKGRGKTPETGTGGGGVTAEEFNEMDINQRMDLYQNNPTLYKQLTGQ